MGYVSAFACWLLAGTFVVAAVAKARDLPAFATSITALGCASRRRARPVAVAVVATELVSAGLCVVPRGATALAGLTLSAGLLTVFGAASLSALHGRRVVPCRCFGSSGAPLGLRHVLRNALLVAVAVCGIAALVSGEPLPQPAGLALVAFVSAISIVLVVCADDVLNLLRNPQPQLSPR